MSALVQPSTAAAAARLPVLIIGSGLGGLILAHSLRASAIPYRLFERDSATDNRAQGYRISIDDGGASALKSALAASPGLFEKFEAGCGEGRTPGGRVDARSGKVLGTGLWGMAGAGGLGMLGEMAARWIGGRWAKGFRGGSVPLGAITVPKTVSKHYPTDRRVLRTLLLSSQSEHITHSAEFSSYTLPSTGGVIAHFTNGTSVPGSLLVGADGVRSAVARQLIGPSAAPRDMGARIIYGKTPLKAIEADLHETLRSGTAFAVDPRPDGSPGLLLVQECMRFHLPASPENYTFWALAGRKEVFEAAEQELGSGSSPAATAEYLTKHWHPSIRTVITNQTPEQTASLRMTTSSTSGTATWETDPRVTVLGDAVHCMPPTGGQGANAALHDAALLGLVLGAAKEKGEGEGGWSKETIGAYEDGMRRNIGDVVGMACIGAKRIIGATIPA